MKRILSLLLLVSTVALAAPLSAPFTHNGIFANASAGVGYASFENADGERSITADGFGVKLHGKLGYYIVQDLALHANVGYVMYSNFREAWYGASRYVDHEFNVLSSVYLGAGATYYVPEWNNVFFSGSLGVTGYDMDCRKYKGNTGLKAFSFDVGAGKDWWVSEHIALGVSVAFNYGKYWSDDDGMFRSSSVMLLFSVTLN